MATHPLVLLLDPNPLLRQLLRAELKDRGCVVVDAEDRDQALQFARIFPGPIDIVVAHESQPAHALDGEFVATLRRLPTTTRSQVIHLTTAPTAADHRGPTGREHYLPAPFDGRPLSNTVSRMLQTRSAAPGRGQRAVFWGAGRVDSGRQDIGSQMPA